MKQSEMNRLIFDRITESSFREMFCVYLQCGSCGMPLAKRALKIGIVRGRLPYTESGSQYRGRETLHEAMGRTNDKFSRLVISCAHISMRWALVQIASNRHNVDRLNRFGQAGHNSSCWLLLVSAHSSLEDLCIVIRRTVARLIRSARAALAIPTPRLTVANIAVHRI